MKFIKRFGWALSIALCCTTMFVGCSDDDDNDDKKTEIEGGTGTDDKESGTDDKESGTDDKEPETEGKIGPSNVFTGKLPNSYAGSAITYDSDGLVTKIEEEDKIATFDYNPTTITKATGDKRVVRMTVYSPEYPEYGKSFFDMTIGDNNYVESCKEINDVENEVKIWEFKYNEDGQLNYMMRSENDNRKTNITYNADGDIIKVEETSDLGEKYKTTVGPGEILNIGCIMMFSITFSIDMDEMHLAYCAGLLGKATKHLPISCKESGSSESYSFQWKLGSDGYPESVTDNYNHKYSDFTWN